MWDISHWPITEPLYQQNAEIELDQYSPSFGIELLPGIYAMPLGVIDNHLSALNFNPSTSHFV
jgi:hypothetical protein